LRTVTKKGRKQLNKNGILQQKPTFLPTPGPKLFTSSRLKVFRWLVLKYNNKLQHFFPEACYLKLDATEFRQV
jgi:hypothetical protein